MVYRHTQAAKYMGRHTLQGYTRHMQVGIRRHTIRRAGIVRYRHTQADIHGQSHMGSHTRAGIHEQAHTGKHTWADTCTGRHTRACRHTRAGIHMYRQAYMQGQAHNTGTQ